MSGFRIKSARLYGGRFGVLGAAVLAPFALAAGAGLQTGKPATTTPTAEQVKFFESQVRPILQTNCVPCHGGEKPSGGLSLLSREATLKGGISGPGLIPAKPATSLLVKAINHDGRKMPPQGKLPQAQIETLTNWVAMGAPWPKAKEGDAPPVKH